MIDRILARSTRFARERPRAVAVLALLAALASLGSLGVPVDLSFAGVMDRSHPEVARYFEASRRYGLGGLLPVLVEGDESTLDEAVGELQLALDGRDEVRAVLVPPPRDWFALRAAWFVPRGLFDRWLALASGPASAAERTAFAGELEVEASRLFPPQPEGARLVTVVLAHDSFELALDADDFPTVRRVVGEVLAPFAATARFAGMAAIITEEQEATLARMRVLGPLSLVLVLAILLVVESRPLVLLSIALPMLLAVGCTLALLGLLEGRLTLMESIFGVLVFGFGVDFAIHPLLRLREERAAGHDFAESLDRAMRGTGRGVVTGAVTTAGAFGLLAFAPDPVFARLGLAGSVGLSTCLVFLLLMLPAQWAWIEARRPARAGPLRAAGSQGLARMAGLAARAPWVVLGATALLWVWACVELCAVRYETNLERVFSREIDALDAADRIHALFAVDPGPWLVAVPDLERARRTAAAFEAEPLFGRADSLATLIPADLDARRLALDALAPELARRLRSEEAQLAAFGEAEAEAAREALAPLSLLLAAHTLGPPSREALPESLAKRWIGADGELLVHAYAAAPALDSAVAARERRAAQAIDPGATSMSAIYEALVGTERPWLPPIIAAVALFIVAVVWLDFRDARLALLALAPVAVAAPFAVGLLTAFGFTFNTVTLVAIPMLLGLGVDDGIHVVHRMVEQPDAPLDRVVGSVGRSILLTTATTAGSVALLLATDHPGIESVAVLLLVGLTFCLLATVWVVPAVAVALGLRARTGRDGGV